MRGYLWGRTLSFTYCCNRSLVASLLRTVGDLELLPRVLEAASRFEDSPGDDAMRMIVEQRRATALFGVGT